ncbi:MAG TPA: hypothetical protein VF360_08085 [Candidatus Methanoperedens sp.]
MAKRKKNSNFLISIIVVLLLLLIGYIYIKNPTVIEKFPIVKGKQPESAVTTPSVTPIVTDKPSSKDSNSTIKLAAFNLQIFGTAKAGKPEVMNVLSKIIRNYDVIAVQEIRDESQTALPKLKVAVNSVGSPQYDYIVSEPAGANYEQGTICVSLQYTDDAGNGKSLRVSRYK